MKVQSLSTEVCRNCGHAMHWHEEQNGPCRFCQTSPQTKCSCRRFHFPSREEVIKLPNEELQKLACAAHLGINPVSISKIGPVYNHNQLIGLDVAVYIFTGDQQRKWFSDNIPTDEDWVLEYIKNLEKNT